MIDIIVRDEGTGALLKMQVAPETTVDELIEATADHWRKPQGMYVLGAEGELLRAGTRASEIAAPGALVLMTDPEGG